MQLFWDVRRCSSYWAWACAICRLPKRRRSGMPTPRWCTWALPGTTSSTSPFASFLNPFPNLTSKPISSSLLPSTSLSDGFELCESLSYFPFFKILMIIFLYFRFSPFFAAKITMPLLRLCLCHINLALSHVCFPHEAKARGKRSHTSPHLGFWGNML